MNQKNVFFNLISPILAWIDNGRFFKDPFKWLYILFAVLNLLFPIVMLVTVIKSEMFSYLSGIDIFAVILIWLFIVFACWIGFQIWWDRKDKIRATSNQDDNFVAIPVFTHFIQTAGEWAGSFYAIVGFGASLVATIFLGGEGSYILRSVGLDAISVGGISMIMAPIIGFLIIVVTRVIAELYRALVEIANNTRKKD